MTEEGEPTPETPPAAPPASDPDPGDLHAASHSKIEQLEDQVEGLRDEMTLMHERISELAAAAPAAEPEHTEVVPRTEEPEKKDDPVEPPPASTPTSERHTGLFI